MKVKVNESAGTRTQDLRLKRPLLYLLSYTPYIDLSDNNSKRKIFFAKNIRQFVILSEAKNLAIELNEIVNPEVSSCSMPRPACWQAGDSPFGSA